MSEKKKQTKNLQNNRLNGEKTLKLRDRDPVTGRFIKGNKASPGRKAIPVELKQLADCQEYLKKYDGDKTKLEWILEKLYVAAIGTSLVDIQAAGLLLRFGCVMPAQKIEQEVTVTQKVSDILEKLERIVPEKIDVVLEELKKEYYANRN